MNDQTNVTEKNENNIDKAVAAAKEKSAPVREEIREKRDEFAAEAKSVAHQASDQAKAALSTQKGEAARQLHGLANSLRHSGVQLRQQNQDTMAHYSYEVADQIDRASGYLEAQNLDDLMQDAKDFARSQPELFLGGAFTVGLLAARFLRSSTPERPARRSYSEVRPGETAVYPTTDV